MEIINSKKKRLYKEDIVIPTPCKDEVIKYLKKWDKLEDYSLQEDALNRLFLEVYPNNTDIREILIKVASLNDFYSTNVYYPFILAKHIHQLNIDQRLQNGDLSLVDDISLLEIEDNKTLHLYSFATKYCSHHKKGIYPIYDSFVFMILKYFQQRSHFSDFKDDDIRNYSRFKQIINDFQDFYNIQDYSIKDIDRYLWQLGKFYFGKKKEKSNDESNDS